MQIVQAPRASAILYSLLVAGDRSRPWLVPANICPIVPLTFLKAQVPFELVDISAETLHMDLQQAEARVGTGRYGGVLYSHTYGEASTPHSCFSFIKNRAPEIVVVDDRCLCVPDLEAAADVVADVTLFSTGRAKFVELGFGGYAFVGEGLDYVPAAASFEPRDCERIERAYEDAVRNRTRFDYRDSDWLDTGSSVAAWPEYRGLVERALEAAVRQRAELNAVYSSRLPEELSLPQPYQNWRFNIRVDNRARVLASIFEAGLFASSHYASLAGIIVDGNAPNAGALASRTINLFNDSHFDVEKVEQVCDVILRSLVHG